MTKIASVVLAMMVGLITCGQRQNNPLAMYRRKPCTED